MEAFTNRNILIMMLFNGQDLLDFLFTLIDRPFNIFTAFLHIGDEILIVSLLVDYRRETAQIDQVIYVQAILLKYFVVLDGEAISTLAQQLIQLLKISWSIYFCNHFFFNSRYLTFDTLEKLLNGRFECAWDHFWRDLSHILEGTLVIGKFTIEELLEITGDITCESELIKPLLYIYNLPIDALIAD